MKKRIFAIGIILIMVITMLTACQNKSEEEDLDYDATVLTVGEHDISLREAYFMLKLQQSSYQKMGASMYGDKWYEEDLTGTGKFIDYIKDSVIEQLENMYILSDNAEKYGISLTEDEKTQIDTAVKNYIESNNESALKAMATDEKTVKELLTTHTVYTKVFNAIVKQANTAVKPEDAQQRTFSYIYQQLVNYDEEGNPTDMTPEEQQNHYNALLAVKSKTEGGTSFDDAAKEYGFSPASHSYGIQDDGSFNDIDRKADQLGVGEVSDVIKVEGGLFLLRLDSDNDEDKLEEARKVIAQELQNDFYSAEYSKLKEGVKIELNEELWDTASFTQAVQALDTDSKE